MSDDGLQADTIAEREDAGNPESEQNSSAYGKEEFASPEMLVTTTDDQQIVVS